MEAKRINRLCEGWQARVHDSDRADQEQFGREFMRLLGWTDPTPLDLPPANVGLAYSVRTESGTSMVIQFLMPGELEAPANVRGRGLDYCPRTRDIVTGIRRSRIEYALITDMHRTYVYDVRQEALLLWADYPDAFNREVGPVVARHAVERGSLDELRRPPQSELAQQLRECCRRWSDTIAATPGGSEALAAMLIDRMILVSHVAQRDIAHTADWSLRAALREASLIADGDEPEQAGDALCAIFDVLWRRFDAQIFQSLPQFRALLEQPAIGAALIRDFAMMAPAKFAIGTILESFNHGPPDEKARVRIVPESDPERDLYLAKMTAATVNDAQISVDLFEEGYRAIFMWFDRMVAECARAYAEAAHRMPKAGEQTDLLDHSKDDTAPGRDAEVAFRYVAENGLKVLYTTPRQYRVGRLMLYLHVAKWYDKTDRPLTRFPDLESAFQKTGASPPGGQRSYLR